MASNTCNINQPNNNNGTTKENKRNKIWKTHVSSRKTNVRQGKTRGRGFLRQGDGAFLRQGDGAFVLSFLVDLFNNEKIIFKKPNTKAPSPCLKKPPCLKKIIAINKIIYYNRPKKGGDVKSEKFKKNWNYHFL